MMTNTKYLEISLFLHIPNHRALILDAQTRKDSKVNQKHHMSYPLFGYSELIWIINTLRSPSIIHFWLVNTISPNARFFMGPLCLHINIYWHTMCVCVTGRYIPSTLLQGTLICLVQAMAILIYYKCGSPFSFFFSKYPTVPFWLAGVHFLRNLHRDI